jgi:hypothetical protein
LMLLLLLVCCCSGSTSNWWWGKITSSSVCNVTPCSKTSEKNDEEYWLQNVRVDCVVIDDGV